jgi:hypothetical protein
MRGAGGPIAHEKAVSTYACHHDCTGYQRDRLAIPTLLAGCRDDGRFHDLNLPPSDMHL